MRLHFKSCRICGNRHSFTIAFIIATTATAAALPIASPVPLARIRHHQRRRHVAHPHVNKYRALFARPPTSSTAIRCRREAKYSQEDAVLVSTTTLHQSDAQIIGTDAPEPPTTTFESLSTSAAKQIQSRAKIRYVPWAGKRGMLPHQQYSGELNPGEYCRWLRIPMDANTSIPINNYFTTVSLQSTSLGNTSSPSIQQIITPSPPQVQPKHLKPIYIDEHIIVVNKPSGVLSVPGPRRHECVASLPYRYFGKSNLDDDTTITCDNNSDHAIKLTEEDEAWQPLTVADNKQIDTMVVHRLDRDTSGVLMFARNDRSLKQLHTDFKDKARNKVNKRYVALVCGHWNAKAADSGAVVANEGEIDLPLVRDLEHPPFMRVATAETQLKQQQLKQQSQQREKQHQNEQDVPENKEKRRHHHSGYLRMVGKGAKESLTTYRILSYEYLVDTNYSGKENLHSSDNNTKPQLLPVTRVELQPITGRTHQLRVHCAAVGHPIVGDSIYGYNGEGSAHGGLVYDRLTNTGASLELQKEIHLHWLRLKQKQNHEGKNNQHPQRHRIIDVKQSSTFDEECMLCLHAYQLSIFHPLTESPMIFDCPPPF